MPEQAVLDENWSPTVRTLFLRYYPEYSDHRFADLLDQHIHPTAHVLEIGAGSGRNNQNHFNLRGKVARYVGIDPDKNILTNPFLDEGFQANAHSLPFADGAFDLVFHHYVAEHFRSPLPSNREIARVLKPGGLLLFQTPNRYYYASVIASLTPQWFHEFYVRRFASGRTSQEVFPTFYRMNDARTIARQLKTCDFIYDIQYHTLPPGYLRFSRVSFMAGVLFERTMERWFPPLRGTITVIARKNSSSNPERVNFQLYHSE
jgi:SAM-dependent methyltransferase